jgi:transcription termination/antitermination protein NusA
MAKKSKIETVKALDIVAAIGAVTKEKSISMDLVLDTLADALASAAKKYLGKPTRVEAKVDREKGTITVSTHQTVVETVVDPENQISLEEAKAVDGDLKVDDELIQDLDIDRFGRSAIQTAKQVLLQRVREAEREKVFADFSERVGELVTGTVQQIDKGNILVNLGRTEALLPFREQIRKERYRQGQNIRACIVEVKNNSKGPMVIISRTCPEFLARLFELEVPEIFDKTVRIVKVVRDPGHRSKIAVTTNDTRVDPVGACVGMRGNRVQAIVRELSNERIDIINWTEEMSLLVRRVFSPAEVKRVIPAGEKRIVVVIREEDLAQAIGREGQNIRLGSKMIDKEIDVFGDEEFNAMTEEQRAAILSETPQSSTESAKSVDGAVPEAADAGPEKKPDNDAALDPGPEKKPDNDAALDPGPEKKPDNDAALDAGPEKKPDNDAALDAGLEKKTDA